MPARIRHNPLGSVLAVTDLPILPFLAPRLLQPWPVPFKSRRSKSSRSACQENGLKTERDANRCVRSSHPIPRTTGGQQCLRQRVRATTPALLSRRSRYICGAEEGKRAHSSEATATRIRGVPEDGVYHPPTQPSAAAQEEVYGRPGRIWNDRDIHDIGALLDAGYPSSVIIDFIQATSLSSEELTMASIEEVRCMILKDVEHMKQSRAAAEELGLNTGKWLEMNEKLMEDEQRRHLSDEAEDEMAPSKEPRGTFAARASNDMNPEDDEIALKWLQDEVSAWEHDTLALEMGSSLGTEDIDLLAETSRLPAMEEEASSVVEDEFAAGEHNLSALEEEASLKASDIDILDETTTLLPAEEEINSATDSMSIAEETNANAKPRRLRRPDHSEFAMLSQAWDVMAEAGKGKSGLTVPFSRHWRTWFGNYHAKLVQQKLERPRQYAKMEEDTKALINYADELEIDEIRKPWLKFLNWKLVESEVQHKEMYVRRIDVSALVAEGGQEAVKGRKAIAEDRWPEIMLNILARRPEDGLDFLVATCVGPLSHRYQYSDVIDYLVKYYMATTVDPKTDLETFRDDFDHLFNSIMILAQKYNESEVGISDFALERLFRHASFEQADALYNALITREKRLGINTRLKIAGSLGRRGATDIAIRILESLHNDQVSFKSPPVESVCATVLRGSQRDADQKIREGQAFERLLELGLQPRINFYNILAHNAIESGDHETAWKVYYMLVENGFEPSAHTYSLLLNDAKLRGDHEALNRSVEIVREKDVRNEYIANDVIHATWLIDEHRRRALKTRAPIAKMERVAFHKVMFLYKQYFETGPLLDLAPNVFKVLQPGYKGFKPADEPQYGKLMHPDTITLNLMINIAVKCRGDGVWELYERWKELLERGHPDFVRVAKSGTAVMDAFIKKLGEHPKTLPLCMHVMTDMLAAQETWNAEEGVVTDPELLEEKRVLKHAHRNVTGKVGLPTQQLGSVRKLPFAKPSVKTWTVLMQAFMEQGQPKAARRVLDMMTARGVKPDQVTWEQLVLGHANMRDQEATVDAMVKAEEAGLPVDGSMLGKIGGPAVQTGIMQQVIRRVQGAAKTKNASYELVSMKEKPLERPL